MCYECFWIKLAFESVDSGKQFAFPMWVGIMQSAEGVNRTERRGWGRIWSLLPSCPSYGMGFSCPDVPGSQPLGLRLNYTLILPGSPTVDGRSGDFSSFIIS